MYDANLWYSIFYIDASINDNQKFKIHRTYKSVKALE